MKRNRYLQRLQLHRHDGYVSPGFSLVQKTNQRQSVFQRCGATWRHCSPWSHTHPIYFIRLRLMDVGDAVVSLCRATGCDPFLLVGVGDAVCLLPMSVATVSEGWLPPSLDIIMAYMINRAKLRSWIAFTFYSVGFPI